MTDSEPACFRCKSPTALDESTTLVTISAGHPKPTDRVMTLCGRCSASLSEFWNCDPEIAKALRRRFGRKLSGGMIVADAIAEKLIERAIGGDVDAIKEILDRTEGKVPDAPLRRARLRTGPRS